MANIGRPRRVEKGVPKPEPAKIDGPAEKPAKELEKPKREKVGV